MQRDLTPRVRECAREPDRTLGREWVTVEVETEAPVSDPVTLVEGVSIRLRLSCAKGERMRTIGPSAVFCAAEALRAQAELLEITAASGDPVATG